MPSTDKIDAYRKAYLAHTPNDNFDREIWQNLHILSTSIDSSNQGTPKISFSITIPKHFSNHNGTMHGGALATLFDGLTGSALNLLRKPGYWDGAQVSRTLEIKYFRPVPLGEKLDSTVEVVHAGRSLATVRGLIWRERDGELLAACQHEIFYPGRGSKL